jgi:hypothetical protein
MSKPRSCNVHCRFADATRSIRKLTEHRIDRAFCQRKTFRPGPGYDLWFDLAPKGQGLVAATPKLGSLHVSLMTDVFRAVKEAGLGKK